MSGKKCHKCGLVNWADTGCCKRCGSVPPPPDYRPGRVQSPAFDTPSLGTFNGIGTRLIGWKHSEDGTATATVWFSLLYLPIFPYGRYRLLSPRGEDFEPGETNLILRLMFHYRRMTIIYRFVERLPLSGDEILGMYLYAYLWVPLKLLAPLLLFKAYGKLFHPPEVGSEAMEKLLICAAVLWMCYVFFMFARLFNRSRGVRTA